LPDINKASWHDAPLKNIRVCFQKLHRGDQMTKLDAKPLITLASLACSMAGFTMSMPVQADAGKGAAIANETCVACHGEDGNSLVPNFPKLAGQQKVYLLRELKDYRSGKRVSELMVPVVSALSEDDLTHLADYYAQQKPAPGIGNDPRLLSVGKNLYLKGNSKTDVPSCDSCHEENGSGFGKFPRLAGQHIDYALDQFRLYATGKRTNGSRVMQAVAQRMSEEETRAVAEFMASMP
jgi:cytochrome c553